MKTEKEKILDFGRRLANIAADIRLKDYGLHRQIVFEDLEDLAYSLNEYTNWQEVRNATHKYINFLDCYIDRHYEDYTCESFCDEIACNIHGALAAAEKQEFV